MLLKIGRFKIESTVVHVDDFKECLVVGCRYVLINLVLKRFQTIIIHKTEIVSSSHDHVGLVSFQRLLCQVSAFIIKKAMAVTRPGYPFHQNSKKNSKSMALKKRFVSKIQIKFWTTMASAFNQLADD